MIAQEPRAWEGLDPEGVHKMRVATRRLRSALRAFKKVLPASIRSFNSEFKWLAAALGGVRNINVAMGNLPHFLSELPPEDAAYMDDYQQYLADQWQEIAALYPPPRDTIDPATRLAALPDRQLDSDYGSKARTRRLQREFKSRV